MVTTDTELAEEQADAEAPTESQDAVDAPATTDDVADDVAGDADADAVTESGDASDEPDAPFDVNDLFESVVKAIAANFEDLTVSPIEPTDAEPTPNATVMSGSMVGLVDANSIVEHFDASAAVEAVIAQVSEDFGLTPMSIEDASEDQVVSLTQTTMFRANVRSSTEDLGDIRIAVAALGTAHELEEASPVEPAVVPAASAPPLTERLPNLAAVDMNVSVELGRVRIPIRELLGLGTGSVVRLGTPIGESFDILVNGKAAARGDLVVVGGRLAVRIRELLGVDS